MGVSAKGPWGASALQSRQAAPGTVPRRRSGTAQNHRLRPRFVPRSKGRSGTAKFQALLVVVHPGAEIGHHLERPGFECARHGAQSLPCPLDHGWQLREAGSLSPVQEKGRSRQGKRYSIRMELQGRYRSSDHANATNAGSLHLGALCACGGRRNHPPVGLPLRLLDRRGRQRPQDKRLAICPRPATMSRASTPW
jgi:hypothetical protein